MATPTPEEIAEKKKAAAKLRNEAEKAYESAVEANKTAEKAEAEYRRDVLRTAVQQVKSIAKEAGIPWTDFQAHICKKTSKGGGGRQSKGEPKYRDPETGKTWTGTGRQPGWFDKDNEERFLIK